MRAVAAQFPAKGRQTFRVYEAGQGGSKLSCAGGNQDLYVLNDGGTKN